MRNSIYSNIFGEHLLSPQALVLAKPTDSQMMQNLIDLKLQISEVGENRLRERFSVASAFTTDVLEGHAALLSDDAEFGLAASEAE